MSRAEQINRRRKSLCLKICFRNVSQIRRSLVVRKLDWLVGIPVQGMSILRFVRLQCLCGHINPETKLETKGKGPYTWPMEQSWALNGLEVPAQLLIHQKETKEIL